MSGAEKNLQRLFRALTSPHAAGMRHVWGILLPDERSAALHAWLTDVSAEAKVLRERRQLLVGIVARELSGFRPATVLSWPITRLCTEAAKLPKLDSITVLTGVILQHHLPKLERLQVPLLDAIGVKHNHGLIESVEDALKGVDKVRLRDGALAAWRATPTSEMALYLLALFTMYPREWRALDQVLPEVASELAGGLATAPSGPSANASVAPVALIEPDESHGLPSTADTGEWRAPSRQLVASETAILSTLDNHLILRIVASVQGIGDAPDERELDDLLLEFVRLSATRHQSFFHFGLHDAMRRRPVLQDLPAENRSRSRWYLAGYINGLQRRTEREGILAVFDNYEEARTLGDTGQGPSALSAEILAGALISADRTSDLLDFLYPLSLLRSRQLSELVLDYATTLARQERYQEALPLLELLWTTLTEERGVSPAFRARVSRRLAQCLREEDELESARDLLLGLVESEDAEHKAMALADLGLISAGVRRLADLTLPANADEAEVFVASMESGGDRFTEAERLDVASASHARYCMGMVALAKQEYSKAESLIESAITAFNRERSRYEPGGLLARANFHLAIARCANVDSKPLRLQRAAATIAEALRGGEVLPDRYASEVIAGLSLRDDAGTIVLMERLLETGGSDLLDRLRSENAAQHSYAVADAYAIRVKAPNRTALERVADCRTALDMFLLQRRFDDAAHMLDVLEEFTEDGVGVREFSALIADEQRLTASGNKGTLMKRVSGFLKKRPIMEWRRTSSSSNSIEL
jgi:hypothetical protein